MLFKFFLAAFIGTLLVNERAFAIPDDEPQNADSSDEAEHRFVVSSDGEGNNQVIVPEKADERQEEESQSHNSEVKPDNDEGTQKAGNVTIEASSDGENKTEEIEESQTNDEANNSQKANVTIETSSDGENKTGEIEGSQTNDKANNSQNAEVNIESSTDGGNKTGEIEGSQTNNKQNNSEPAVDDKQQSNKICPNGWFSLDRLNQCCYISSSYQNWNESLALCNNLGGSLASFHSIGEAKFLEGKLVESAWIGLNDQKVDGIYKWSDGTLFDFKNWGEDEPSSFSKLPLIGSSWSKAREDCVEIKKSKGFKWNDELCSSYRQAICSRNPEQMPRTACPEGWTSDGNKTCYKLNSIKANYKSASEICSLSAVGGALATPSTEAQNQFLANIVKEKNISIWIGVNDMKEENMFRTNDGKVQTFFKWNTGQPSESSKWYNWFNEDCVQMIKTGRWNDDDCDAAYNFVCTIALN